MSILIDNMLNELLSNFDFSPRETEVLSCLLSYSALPASLIARKTKIKRPTVYAILEKLVDRGLVTRKKQSNSTYFAAVRPEMLTGLLESRAERKFVESQNAAKDILTLLHRSGANRGVDFQGFEIELLESYDAVYQQLYDALTGGDFDAIFNPQLVLERDGKKIVADFLKETGKSEPHIREIAVRGPQTDWYKQQVRNRNHTIKEIGKNEKILSDMILSKGSVYVLHYAPPDELAIQIRHGEFYETLSTMFELLWNKL